MFVIPPPPQRSYLSLFVIIGSLFPFLNIHLTIRAEIDAPKQIPVSPHHDHSHDAVAALTATPQQQTRDSHDAVAALTPAAQQQTRDSLEHVAALTATPQQKTRDSLEHVAALTVAAQQQTRDSQDAVAALTVPTKHKHSLITATLKTALTEQYYIIITTPSTRHLDLLLTLTDWKRRNRQPCIYILVHLLLLTALMMTLHLHNARREPRVKLLHLCRHLHNELSRPSIIPRHLMQAIGRLMLVRLTKRQPVIRHCSRQQLRACLVRTLILVQSSPHLVALRNILRTLTRDLMHNGRVEHASPLTVK